MTKSVVIYDSCVLYPAPLRDLLIRLALLDFYHAKWTKDIHKEWMRNLLKNRPDISEEKLHKTREKMDLHARDCLVEGYEDLIESIQLPDPDDRHVVAAAIRASAQIIITYNLSDFPKNVLSKYEIEAQHPDEFLRHIIDIAPARFMQAINETRLSLKNPPKSQAEYLAILGQQSLPRTVAFLQNYEQFI